MYLDRGAEFGGPDDRPGDDTDRFLEYWNHVFMSYELHEDGSLTPLPENNIDTGMGLERMAAILQGVGSVFETDAYPAADRPRRGACPAAPTATTSATTRAMRIIADHSRGTTFLIADGVVPSNEERGYVLRRVMRRAIQQGRVLGLETPWLGAVRRAGDRDDGRRLSRARRAPRDDHPLGGGRGGGLRAHARPRHPSFSPRLVAEAKDQGTSWVDAEDAFMLHDTYGFPYDLTKELLAEEGLSVDDSGLRGADGEAAPAGAKRRGGLETATATRR